MIAGKINRKNKIEYIERDMQVTRNTASKYLQMIVNTGLVEKVKVGKTNYYFNTKLIDLFLNHNSKEKTSVESIESVLDLWYAQEMPKFCA